MPFEKSIPAWRNRNLFYRSRWCLLVKDFFVENPCFFLKSWRFHDFEMKSGIYFAFPSSLDKIENTWWSKRDESFEFFFLGLTVVCDPSPSPEGPLSFRTYLKKLKYFLLNGKVACQLFSLIILVLRINRYDVTRFVWSWGTIPYFLMNSSRHEVFFMIFSLRWDVNSVRLAK